MSSALIRLAAVESRSLDCADVRSNPTMRRGPSRLVEREQKTESHLVMTHKGKAGQLRDIRRTPPHGPEASRRLAGKLIGTSGRLPGSLAMPYPPVRIDYLLGQADFVPGCLGARAIASKCWIISVI